MVKPVPVTTTFRVDVEHVMAKVEDRDIEEIEQELVKAGLFAVRLAKQKAPVDTGRLRASISIADSTGVIQEPDSEASTGDGVTTPSSPGIRFGTNVEYAEFLEYGTVFQAAQPFIRPAWEESANRFNIET